MTSNATTTTRTTPQAARTLAAAEAAHKAKPTAETKAALAAAQARVTHKAEFVATTYANGFRAARAAAGYGRVACAKALGITTSALWAIEHNLTAAEAQPHIKAVKALPVLGAGAKGSTPVKAKALKVKASDII